MDNSIIERLDALYEDHNAWADFMDAMEDDYPKLRAELLRLQAERDEWKAKAERLEEQGWLDPGEATHYCCMHMRWETREGAEA